MIMAAHQPQYLPWLGYFDKIDQADLFVLLDNVQFKKNEWQNRNRIRTAQGWQWLTVPVRHRYPQGIDQVEIADRRWAIKHSRTLRQAYARASCFEDETELIDTLYDRQWSSLADLNIESIRLLAGRFGITTELLIGSENGSKPQDHPDDRLIGLARRLGADTYLAGTGGREYMDLDRYRRAGIEVRFQDFRHPEYPQHQGRFEAGMSAVDLLFNCGGEGFAMVRRSREVKV